MIGTFGPDNAIAWVQTRLKGGPRNLLVTALAYSMAIALAMTVVARLSTGTAAEIFGGWVAGILGLQTLNLVVFASSRIIAAIRQDQSSGMIESHRLMPIAAPRAIVGYILGGVSQAACIAVANFFLGAIAALLAWSRLDGWIDANVILLGFAAFVWVVAALVAFYGKGVVGLFVFFPLVAQGGMIALLPGVLLLVTPLHAGSIFDLRSRLPFADTLALATAAQFVIAAILFAAAARRYARADARAFSPLLGLLLLAAWTGVSLLGIVDFDRFRFAGLRGVWATPTQQVASSFVVALLIGLLPVWSAADERIAWFRRRMRDPEDAETRRPPISDVLVIVAAALLVTPLALRLPTPAELPESLLPPALAAAVMLVHLLIANSVRRTFRYYTDRLGVVVFLVLCALWVGPVLVDAVRQTIEAKPVPLTLTEISCISPAGAVIALADARFADAGLGLAVQTAIAAAVCFIDWRVSPQRRVRRKRGELAAGGTSD